jgi:hypothetical protein
MLKNRIQAQVDMTPKFVLFTTRLIEKCQDIMLPAKAILIYQARAFVIFQKLICVFLEF